jgi:hypothetical protein
MALAWCCNRLSQFPFFYKHPQSTEQMGVEITQLPSGFKGKIVFSEPKAQDVESKHRSVDNLLHLANAALAEAGMKRWMILLDRLDVAFAEDARLEANAIRALFRVYLDLLAFQSIGLKIFLRNDI